MRPPKPDFVIQWERKEPAPQCCHTCELYDKTGLCLYHNQRPPAEFAAALDQCDQWQEVIPF